VVCSSGEIAQTDAVFLGISFHVGGPRLDRLAAHCSGNHVQEGVPAHRVLLFEAVENGQVRERQQHVAALGLQLERQIRFGIGGVFLTRTEYVPGVCEFPVWFPLSDDTANMATAKADAPAFARFDRTVFAVPGRELLAIGEVLPDAIDRSWQRALELDGQDAHGLSEIAHCLFSFVSCV